MANPIRHLGPPQSTRCKLSQVLPLSLPRPLPAAAQEVDPYAHLAETAPHDSYKSPPLTSTDPRILHEATLEAIGRQAVLAAQLRGDPSVMDNYDSLVHHAKCLRDASSAEQEAEVGDL